MNDRLALLSEAEKLARIADHVSHAYAFELARVLRDLERELRVLAGAAVQGSRSALARSVRAARLRKEIQVALEAAGYKRLAQTTASAGLDRILAQVFNLRLAAKLAGFSASDMTRILALKTLASMDLFHQGQVIAHSLWRTLMQGLFSQRPYTDLLEDLSDAIDVQLSEARTLYDTQVNVFGRQVEALKSTPEDVYAYMGPADVKLRPFCREHVGKVYTKAQIDALDNGQLPNVFLTGGGYNCRHMFVSVSKFSELRDLLGSGERVPEIEDALKRNPVSDRRAA
jgi:hypothetical protein